MNSDWLRSAIWPTLFPLVVHAGHRVHVPSSQPVGGCFYTPEKNLPFSFYIAQLAQLGPWRVLCGYKKRCVAVLGLAAGL